MIRLQKHYGVHCIVLCDLLFFFPMPDCVWQVITTIDMAVCHFGYYHARQIYTYIVFRIDIIFLWMWWHDKTRQDGTGQDKAINCLRSCLLWLSHNLSTRLHLPHSLILALFALLISIKLLPCECVLTKSPISGQNCMVFYVRCHIRNGKTLLKLNTNIGMERGE